MKNALKIRDKDGKWVGIPAISGADGKSAYEQAKEGGYAGTEEQFIQTLATLSGVSPVQLAENAEYEEHITDKNNPHEVTVEQVGAIPELIGNSVNVKMKFLLGDHNKMNSIDANVPVLPIVSNYIHMYTMADGLVMTCLSIPYDYTQNAYYYTACDKSWRKFADASGGVFSGNIDVFADKSKNPSISVGETSDNRIRFMYTTTGNLDIQNVRDGGANTLSLSHEKDVPIKHLLTMWANGGNNYKIFGDHNKPMGSYVGDGKTSRQINTGGIGNALLVWHEESLAFAALVTPRGTIFFEGSTLQASGTDRFENGILYTNGTFIDLNNNGRTYKYQVL